ncbi:hypothetical protein [Mesorhizobium sp. B2-4-17]|uniref:hypothetical protein n=1 Tax=Mesorhizobium sp. B2-4-17 TaxID=2589932 RepID=UPI00112AEA4B|nr:hypothetical protein [Mesorhizobium sp. B2-4-17]TPK85447.1 hypothetical protein FJ548_16600 [Mesorhizobium sp. B2-4-17]
MSDELLHNMVELVERHYSSTEEPLPLAKLGQLLGSLRQPLLNAYGRLSDAVDAAGGDRVQLVGRGQPGRVTVVTPLVREAVEKQLAEAGSAGSSSFDRLPAPIKIAFCVRTKPGERVAVRTAAPMHYTLLQPDEAVPSVYTLIDAKYRKPGLKLETASVAEKADLWRAYLDWADAAEFDAGLLASKKRSANALERLLAAQPADIVDRMNLPADIVALLLRHS